jgi:NADH-quinone oxidoreductase subunit A
MEGSLITVLLTIVMAVAMIGSMLVASWLVPKLINKTWLEAKTDTTPYECGSRPFEPVTKHRFSVKFYLVAMLFILFDIEAAFLYPWATVFREMGPRAFEEMAIFIGVLLVGLIYCWRRGALDWD